MEGVMTDKNLREAVRKFIKKEVSKNPQITKEGIVSGILDTIAKSLKKANDKRFRKSLEDLANDGPEGKKAADHLIKSLEIFDDAADHVNAKLKSLGFEK